MYPLRSLRMLTGRDLAAPCVIRSSNLEPSVSSIENNASVVMCCELESVRFCFVVLILTIMFLPLKKVKRYCRQRDLAKQSGG